MEGESITKSLQRVIKEQLNFNDLFFLFILTHWQSSGLGIGIKKEKLKSEHLKTMLENINLYCYIKQYRCMDFGLLAIAGFVEIELEFFYKS